MPIEAALGCCTSCQVTDVPLVVVLDLRRGEALGLGAVQSQAIGQGSGCADLMG